MDFLTACGAAGTLTFDIEGPGYPTPRRWVSPHPYVLIGRDDRADLVLDDESVSRRHAYLQLIDGRLFFIDLDSRTGTSAGSGPAESGWLAPGRALQVGPYAIRLVPTGAGDLPDAQYDPATGELIQPPNPLLARSKDLESRSDLSRVTLEFQSRTSGHSVWRMSQLLALVGSSARCRVRLIDSNVSKLHCALIRTPRGLWVVDLLGRNGITVNGVPTRAGRLGPADVLGLGQMVIRATFEGGSPQDREGEVPVNWANFEFGSRPTPPPGAGLPERQPARGWNPAAGNAGPIAPLNFTPTTPPALSSELSNQEPALSLLLNHFGQMQQQMLDQFQQSMMMMLQMFSGMHRDQMGLVREELDRLRELNNEIATIKTELAHRQTEPRGRNGRPEPGAHAAGPGGSIPMPPPPPRPNPSSAWPQPGVGASAAAPPGPQAQPQPDPQQAPPLEPTRDVHDWLNERLTAISVEQQNRWQRVMSLLRSNK